MMFERFQYINHLGEVIEFGKNGIFANDNDLRDYSWNVTSSNNKISSFNKGIVQKAIPVIICSHDKEKAISTKNMLYEVIEKDVLTKQHGKIIIGNYYLKCYVTGSKKSKYLDKKGQLQLSLTVKTDYPSWMRETTTVFGKEGPEESESEYLDYDNDYEYDFQKIANNIVTNDDFVASNFRIVFHGFCSNPKIIIAGHEYSVNMTVGAGEQLTIDSTTKKIYLTKPNGSQVNCYNLRNKDSYIFEKIPSGINTVILDGGIVVDVTVIEERGEPSWT